MKPLRYLIALSVGLMITNVPSRGQEKRLPTLFIIGDSTVKNSLKNCPLAAFLLNNAKSTIHETTRNDSNQATLFVPLRVIWWIVS